MKPVTTKSIAPFVIPNERGRCATSVSRGRGELQNLADGKPLPLSNEQMKQIEDLTARRWAFLKNAVTRSMSLTRRQ